MKDAYYFSHDSNAKDDPKNVLLIEQLGLEGYGIFWVLTEVLRDQPEYKYPLSLLSAMARKYNTTPEKVEAVVKSYGLFEIENGYFYSNSLNRRMKYLEEKREKKSIAGKISAEKRKQIQHCSNTVPTHSSTPLQHCSTSKVKESKVKESILNIKESDIPQKRTQFIKPTLQEIKAYCQERNNGVNPEKFFNHYEANGWVQGKGKPIKDWKACVRTWEQNSFDNKPQPQNYKKKSKHILANKHEYDFEQLEKNWLNKGTDEEEREDEEE